jgi:DNA-binding NarL/FixJ family response regulator
MPFDITSSDRARVLVVDDNEAVLTRATTVLASDCVVVGTARDGRTALEVAKTLQPDVIVLDIGMPGMSGLEVACSLRDAGSTAKLVFLTVHNEEEFVLAARASGGIGYVVKPRIASDLMVAVREARAGRPFVSAIR